MSLSLSPSSAAAASARLVPGTLPRSWADGTRGPEPQLQCWAYEPTTHIFRESPSAHFEAPFVYLIVGARRALLVDSGTGSVDLRSAVDRVLAGRDVDLIVAHTHGHDDHIGGDAQLARRPRTTVVGRSKTAIATAFGFTKSRPFGSIDLGIRTIDVIAVPGHEASHVAFYDRKTGLLLTGDMLYPGRLYVRDFAAYRASIERLVAFTAAGHPISHVLGSHIELAADGTEYPPGASVHADEHALALPVEQLHDLRATLMAMGASPARTVRPHYVVVPVH